MGNILEYSVIFTKISESNNYWNVEIFLKKIISKIFFLIFFARRGGNEMGNIFGIFWNFYFFKKIQNQIIIGH
jgi:hypothetical protein